MTKLCSWVVWDVQDSVFEGIVTILKAYKSMDTQGVKHVTSSLVVLINSLLPGCGVCTLFIFIFAFLGGPNKENGIMLCSNVMLMSLLALACIYRAFFCYTWQKSLNSLEIITRKLM